MNTTELAQHSERMALIWSIAELLRGDFKASDYGKVVLPFTVLRRLDAVLEGKKDAVLKAAASIPLAADEAMREAILNRAAGQSFHNASKFTFSLLVADPAGVADNLRAYVNGFSPAIRDVFLGRFDLNAIIARLDAANLLFLVVKRFAEVDLHPDRVSNLAMGYVFEELIRRFAEQSNETAGEHFTPREVIRLMVNLLLAEDTEALTQHGAIRSLYDPAFPRFHQLDAVTKLLAHARIHGAGQNYLVQHSAGSGKSNSIAWLAHQAAGLHGADDKPVFTSVIVITDRRVLDKQLQDNIFQFEHKQGVVQKVDADSAQLAAAINAGTPIIITTLQKFSFVIEKVTARGDRRYAVIVDEAHGSQTGEGAAAMKRVLASTLDKAEAEDPDEDPEGEMAGEIEKAMAARGRQPNISFFAFTATPKKKTLELFGQPGPDGRPIAFHTYPMRQAIEEGFILDVLRSYTTYKAYYRFAKAVEEDPAVDAAKAKRAVARFASLHPHNLAQKVEVMVEHFRQHTRHKIGGKAKAMLVTRSRLHAVRYRQAFADYIAKKGYTDVGVLVAFSGTVVSEGDEFTEPGMNGFGEKELPEKFDTDDYHVLIVAEKYQTGFDQPLLHTMFVDRKLKGLKAVQTLSRLNRTAPGKEDTFVLDFENEAEDIKEAFAPYYEVPGIDQPTDPNQLYTVKTAIEGFGYIWTQEITDFSKVFFKPKDKQKPADQGLIHAALDPAVGRFKAEPDEDRREEFRSLLAQFVRLYGFVSQIMPWADAELEKFYAYARHLRPKLPQREGTGTVDLDDEVALTYYRLSKTGEQQIILPAGEGQVLTGPTKVGTAKGGDPDLSPLSTIIQTLNTKFGTDFTEADRLLFEQVATDLSADDGLTEQARTNPIENFRLVFEPAALAALVARMERNGAISERLMGDADFRAAAMEGVMREVWMRARLGSDGAGGVAAGA